MAAIFCILVGLLFAFEPITDNDYFWHYVVGNNIANLKSIPTHELFSWASGKAWVAHEWLTELIMYKIGNYGAIIAMLLIFTLLFILMTKMLKIDLKKVLDFKYIYLLIMCVFFKVTGPRPYILSLLFFAYLVYILFNYLEDKEKYKKWIWTLPVLQIIWVNLHGGSSSMIYIFLIGTLMCDLFLKIVPLKNERYTEFRLDKEQIKTLLIVFGLTIVASCINPFGYKMLLYPFQNMLDKSMTSYIVEWASPSFHNFFGLYIFIIVAFPLINLILNKKKMKLQEVAFQLLLFYMALKSQRFIGMYGIYSCYNLGKYFFVEDEFYKKIKKPFAKYENLFKYASYIVMVLALILVCYKQVHSFSKTGIIDNDGFYSEQAIDVLIDNKPERLYNDYSQGGYLLYRLNEANTKDKPKIFAYGLGDVFSNDILPDTVNLQDLLTDPEEILNKYNFDFLITTKNHTLHYYLEAHPDYRLIYQDDMCFIFKNLKDIG